MHSVRYVQWWMVGMAMSLSACGQNPHSDHDRPPIEGSITDNVMKLNTGQFHDPCEAKYAGPRLEIAKILDERAAQIDAMGGSPSKSEEDDNWKPVRMGSSWVSEPKQPPKIKPGWQTFKRSWEYIIQFYQKIKDDPQNPDWFDLNASVKGILSDDRDRAVVGFNYVTGRENAPVLKAVKEKLTRCLGDSRCDLPEFTPEETTLIRRNSIYARKLEDVRSAAAGSDRSTALAGFEKWVTEDYEFYRFRPNKNIKRPSASQMILPIDGTIFSDAYEQIAGYVESVWKKDGLALKVQWVGANDLPDLYHMVLEKSTGARSFVTYRTHEVHLFPYVRSVAIAHEFGHVLGFPDRYYTTWDSEQCGYQVEYSDEDIMSGCIGHVMDDEWKELEENYPVPKT